jgi:hypothetical protein
MATKQALRPYRRSGRAENPQKKIDLRLAQSEAGQDRFVVIETDFKNHVLEIER